MKLSTNHMENQAWVAIYGRRERVTGNVQVLGPVRARYSFVRRSEP